MSSSEENTNQLSSSTENEEITASNDTDNNVDDDDVFIRSVDTLNGTTIDETIPIGWNDKPPDILFVPPKLTTTIRNMNGKASKIKQSPIEQKQILLKGVMRQQGVPPTLRCAVWISNIIQVIHPYETEKYWNSYRLISKKIILNETYNNLLQNKNIPFETSSDTSSNDDSLSNVKIPTYGRISTSNDNNNNVISSLLIPNEIIHHEATCNINSLKRVLLSLEHVIGYDLYSPMIPSIVGIFLHYMSESYVFCCIREMIKDSTYYMISTSKREYNSWCLTFGKILRKLHVSTCEYMYDRGILDVDNLSPIFSDWFVTILPIKYVFRIVDEYTIDGIDIILRYGIALVDYFKSEKAVYEMIATSDEFWLALRRWTYSNQFNFDYLVKKAYGTLGRSLNIFQLRKQKQLVFPRWKIIERIIKYEQRVLEEEEKYTEDNDHKISVQPVGLVPPPPPSPYDPINQEQIKPILASSIDNRIQLATFLPLHLRLNNINLIFSTNYHGRTLERFYSKVKHAKHTIVLCEVLSPNNNEVLDKEKTIVGMFASQCWHVSTRVYGDGECFLFRLQPNSQCYKWRPKEDDIDDDEDFSSAEESQQQHKQNAYKALLEQFMVSTETYISMGGTVNGGYGLRLNEDLTVGESSSNAVGFNNEQLVSTSTIFDVGLVEVYEFKSPW